MNLSRLNNSYNNSRLKVMTYIQSNGTQEWYHHGKLHRNSGKPAVICCGGTEMWYYCGERHRDDDLPALMYINGDLVWYQHGKMCRDGGKTAWWYYIGYSANDRCGGTTKGHH